MKNAITDLKIEKSFEKVAEITVEKSWFERRTKIASIFQMYYCISKNVHSNSRMFSNKREWKINEVKVIFKQAPGDGKKEKYYFFRLISVLRKYSSLRDRTSAWNPLKVQVKQFYTRYKVTVCASCVLLREWCLMVTTTTFFFQMRVRCVSSSNVFLVQSWQKFWFQDRIKDRKFVRSAFFLQPGIIRF